jgi:hypothetical protein
VACRRTPIECLRGDTIPKLSRVRQDRKSGWQYYANCPAHDDREPSLSIKPGQYVRLVWHCEAGCDSANVRAGLLGLGIDAGCLGNYGTSKAKQSANAAEKKLLRITDLLSEPMPPHLLRMRVLSIIEGTEDLPSDRAAFLALARRSGVGRAQSYEAWKRWECPTT